MSSKLITDIINGSNGDINADFFINANLTEIMNLLEENEGNLDTMKWVGKTFECYSTNRFIGVDSENELEKLARTLNDDGSFFAGIFFFFAYVANNILHNTESKEHTQFNLIYF